MPIAWGFADGNPQLAPLGEAQRLYGEVKPLQPQYWRLMASWVHIARTQTERDWSTIDRCLDDVLSLGAEVVMIIGQGHPSWANPAEYGKFCAEVATRYEDKVGIFELWNEPNAGNLWAAPTGNIDPGVYTEYLKAGYTRIKQVQPDATVLFAGLQHVQETGPWWGDGSRTEQEITFLQKCWDYEPRLGDFFDAMATHVYTQVDTVAAPPAVAGTMVGPAPDRNNDNFRQVRAIRDLMVTKGVGDKPIWITEMGYNTQQLTETQQHDYMRDCYNLLAELPYVGVVIFYNARDMGPDGGNVENTWGVLRHDFTHKQAWSFLQSMVGLPSDPPPAPPPAPNWFEALIAWLTSWWRR